MPCWQADRGCREPCQAPSDNGVFAITAQPGKVADMDRLLADQTVSALQALFEACNVLADSLSTPRREKVEKILLRVQQARATIMAEMM